MSEIGGIDNSSQIAAEEARRREEERKRAEEEARKKAEAEEARKAQEAQEAEEAKEAEEAQEEQDLGKTAGSIWSAYESGEISQSEAALLITQLEQDFEFGPTAEQSSLVQSVTEDKGVSETDKPEYLTPGQVSSVQDVASENPIIDEAQARLLETAKAVIPGKENWTDEEIVQAVAIFYTSSMTDGVASALNSPDSYGWTGELRNSLVEFFGYDNSFEDLTKIIDCQQDGMDLLRKAVSGDLTKQDVYDYSKEKLETDPNYRLIEDAVDYLPYDIAVDWAQNGIPEDIQLHLAVRCTDGYMGYYTPTVGEFAPVDTVHVMGIIISQNNEDIYSNINQLNNDDFYVDDSYTIHYNDALEPYSLGEDANSQVDFNSVYELVQGQEFSPEKLGRYLDAAQSLEYLKPSMDNVTDFTNNILGAETYSDLINVFVDYYGNEDLALEQLNYYLSDTIHPNRENFMTDEQYEKCCEALASAGEFGVGRSTTDIQVRKNSDGSYSLIRKFADGTETEDDPDMPSVCSAFSGACNTEFFSRKLDDALRSETGMGLQDYINEFQESFADLSGLSNKLDAMIQDYDKKEKNSVNVVAGVGTTAAVITALALAPASGGTSLALLGAASSGGSALGTSVAIASVVGGSTNTLIRGTNAASAGKEYSVGTGIKDFASGAIQGSVVPLSAGLFKYAYNLTGLSASYGLAVGSQTSPLLASVAQSPLASTGIKFLATTTAGAVSGNFAGEITAANNYIFYNDNEFDFGEFLQTTSDGGRNGARFGATMAFGAAVVSELPYLNSLAQNGFGYSSGEDINLIPGYNSYITNSDGSIALPLGYGGETSEVAQLGLGSGNTPLALPAGTTPLALPAGDTPLALPAGSSSSGISPASPFFAQPNNLFSLPGITPAQMSYANALAGLTPSIGVPPQAQTVPQLPAGTSTALSASQSVSQTPKEQFISAMTQFGASESTANALADFFEQEGTIVSAQRQVEITQDQIQRILELAGGDAESVYFTAPKSINGKGEVTIKSYTNATRDLIEISDGALNPENARETININELFQNGKTEATVVFADDCSISGSSMITDALNNLNGTLEPGQTLNVVFNPSVMGEMANQNLHEFSQLFQDCVEQGGVTQEMKDFITYSVLDPTKTDGINAATSKIEALAREAHENGATITFHANDGILAQDYRNTPTYQAMDQSQRELIDLWMCAGKNGFGYKDCRTMVLIEGYQGSPDAFSSIPADSEAGKALGVGLELPEKGNAPNNNALATQIYARALGIPESRIKISGLLSQEDAFTAGQSHKMVASLMQWDNRKGNFNGKVFFKYEVPDPITGQMTDCKTVKFNPGDTVKVSYQVQVNGVMTEQSFDITIPPKAPENQVAEMNKLAESFPVSSDSEYGFMPAVTNSTMGQTSMAVLIPENYVPGTISFTPVK